MKIFFNTSRLLIEQQSEKHAKYSTIFSSPPSSAFRKAWIGTDAALWEQWERPTCLFEAARIPPPEQGTRTLFFLFFLSLKLEPTLQALVVLEGSGKKKLEAVRN
jgi:hypothetical protein